MEEEESQWDQGFPQSELEEGFMELWAVLLAPDNEQPDHDIFRVFDESI